MSERKLKDWVQGYVLYCKQREAPKNFKEWIALSTLASTVGREVWMPWHSEVYESQHTFPNMYILLVAPSGVRKSTALGPSIPMLKGVDTYLAPTTCTWQALIQEWAPRLPTAAGNNPLTVCMSEMATFLQQDSKKSNLHTHLTDIFDCGDTFDYKLIGRELQTVNFPCLNMIGGTTPDGLKKIVPVSDAAEGLLGRFIPLYGHKVEYKVTQARLCEMEDPHIAAKLKHDLAIIKQMTGPFTWEQEFWDTYHNWYHGECETLDPDDPFNSPLMSSYMQRRPIYLHKLSMLFSVSESSEMRLKVHHFQRAKETLEAAESNFQYVFNTYGSDYSVAMQDLKVFLKTRKKVKRSEVYARVLTLMSSYEVEQQLEHLLRAGLIQVKGITGNMYDKLITWIPEGERDVKGSKVSAKSRVESIFGGVESSSPSGQQTGT